MGISFGDNPAVTTKITVKHSQNVLNQDEKEHLTWFNCPATATDQSRARVEDSSRQTGYQYYQLHEHLSYIQETRVFPRDFKETGFPGGLSYYSGTQHFRCRHFPTLLTIR